MLVGSAPSSGVRRFATGRAIVAMMLREMVTTYGRSPGGYLWAVLEPVAAIAVLSMVFSLIFRSPVLGDNFPLFYAAAYLPFMLFLDVTNKLAISIRFSKPLLAYPAVTLVDVILARFFLNVLTHIVVFVTVIAGIAVAFDLTIRPDLPKIMNAIGMSGALALGIGTVNCYIGTTFPIYDRIWQIATRPLVIVSGLFFLFESIPERYGEFLWFNPLFHITGEMRDGIYSIYEPVYVSPLYVYTLSMCLFSFGLLLLRRSYRDLVNM